MENKLITKVLFTLALILLISFIILIAVDLVNISGPVLIGFFLVLALCFYTIPPLKGYVYAVMIFGVVALGMYYPEYFIQFGDFKLTGLITPLIQIIMFGMGTSMSAKDFVSVFKTPKSVLIGVTAQYIIMPLSGFGLALMSDLPAEIAAGIVLIGCSPSGMASNVMAYLAKANLALSLTITSVATLLAPFVTPILMKILAGEFIEIDVLAMTWSIVKMIIIPIGAGLLFNKLFSNRTKLLDQILPLVSMIGIALIIIVITAAGRDSLLEIGLWLMFLVLIHNCLGYFVGYWYARAFKLSEKDARTIAIEVGMQNGGLASGIANSIGKIATMGLAPAIFGPLMNVTGSILASYWYKRPPKDVD